MGVATAPHAIRASGDRRGAPASPCDARTSWATPDLHATLARSPSRNWCEDPPRVTVPRRSEMYHFAIVALLALATLKLVDFLVDNIPGLERFRSLGTFL